ncbi:hypothetical protein [Fundidesulfovibrio putealis]|uniref:hypothetical protein n=1 Tax=Fundidesulfovibrio putealis TaxID=270496 RepID=UPI0004833017|nr:hypothetical protein [Fundidesulfovibrio putealis]
MTSTSIHAIEPSASVAPSLPSGRTIAWDGLSLVVPSHWEPARLGLGFLMLEDASGPRLSLRWQRIKGVFDPEKVLKRLARRKLLKPSRRPDGAVSAMLSSLSPEYQALPCAGTAGGGADGLLFTIPGSDLAVLAAPHARPDEKASPWVGAATSLAASDPAIFSLFDVAGQAPPGFRLAVFSVQLGHFHFQFRKRASTLDYYRFAPAEVILRAKSLDGWACEVFAQALNRPRVFAPGYFYSAPACRFEDSRRPGVSGSARAQICRLFPSFRFARAMAWRPDDSKILAVIARHRGELSPESFEEVCRRYAVQAL